MGIEINTSLQAFAARNTNQPQLLQSSIVVDCTFAHYTTMGFSHCSSKCNSPVEDCLRKSANFALSRVQNSPFTDWPSVSECQLRPTTTTGKSPTRLQKPGNLINDHETID